MRGTTRLHKEFVLFRWLYFCGIHLHIDILMLKSASLNFIHIDAYFAFWGNLEYRQSSSVIAAQMFEENYLKKTNAKRTVWMWVES